MTAVDPFETLGLSPRFGIPRAELEARHRELAKTLHPDRHRDRPVGERRMLLERAMKVNEAYRLVRDPVRRARELLRLTGQPVEEGVEPSPPADFLMEVMEERETLAAAAAARDLARVEALTRQVSARRDETEAELAIAFDQQGGRDAEALLPLVAKLRYDARFLEEAEQIAEALGA